MLDQLLSLLPTLITWDTDLFLFLNCHHCQFMDNFMELYSDKWIWIPFYISFWWVMFKNYSWKVTLTCLIVITILITISDQTTSSLLKPMVERMRPSNPDNPLSQMTHIVDGYRGGRFGFPSSHSANAWSLTFFAIYLVRRQILAYMLIIWSLLMCYSRIYLGVHYPGDVFVGMLIGLINASIVYYIFQRLRGEYTHVFKPIAGKMRYAWVPVAMGGLLLTSISISAFLHDFDV